MNITKTHEKQIRTSLQTLSGLVGKMPMQMIGSDLLVKLSEFDGKWISWTGRIGSRKGYISIDANIFGSVTELHFHLLISIDGIDINYTGTLTDTLSVEWTARYTNNN